MPETGKAIRAASGPARCQYRRFPLGDAAERASRTPSTAAITGGEKEHSPGLDLVWLVEQDGQGAGDGCGEGAVLVEGLGRDEDQTGVGLAGGAVAGVQGHEVLRACPQIADQPPSQGRIAPLMLAITPPGTTALARIPSFW